MMMNVAHSISAKTVKHRIDAGDSLQLVDVRSRFEFCSGHLPGSSNIPLLNIKKRLTELNPSSTIVLVCHSGGRAAIAAQFLRRRHADVLVLQGGTIAWKAERLPLVTIPRPHLILEQQVRLASGLLLLLGLLLSIFVSIKWLYLSIFAGLGLTYVGVTTICAIGLRLERMLFGNPAQHPPASVSSHPEKDAHNEHAGIVDR